MNFGLLREFGCQSEAVESTKAPITVSTGANGNGDTNHFEDDGPKNRRQVENGNQVDESQGWRGTKDHQPEDHQAEDC